MKPCGFAGPQCPREATVTVRFAMIGDRSICAEHLAWAEQMGMAFRVLDQNAFKPEWTRRNLTRDMTGRVLA